MDTQQSDSALVNVELTDLDFREMEVLQVLKGLIEEEVSLKEFVIEDKDLLSLLRSRRCNPDLALQVILTMLDYKNNKYPELFTKIRAESIKHVLDKHCFQVVKRKGDSGPVILAFRIEKWDTSEASMDELIMAALQYQYAAAINSVEVQRKGMVLIIDVGAFGFSHARQCTFGNILKLVNLLLYALPIRIRGCYLANGPYIFEKVYQVVQYAIPETYRNFIQMTTTDWTHLHKLVSPDGLPVSLGGTVLEDEAWETSFEVYILENDEVLKFISQLSPDLKKEIENL